MALAKESFSENFEKEKRRFDEKEGGEVTRSETFK